MWQQVSGQINTRFPGFLLCSNPQAVLAVDPGEAWDHVFSLCFFFLYLWIWQHWAQANYLLKKENSAPWTAWLTSEPRRDPRRSPSGGGMSRIYMTVLTKDNLQLKSCETRLLAHGAEMIPVLNVPFGSRVSVKHFASRGCFFKRSLPHFPADFTHPIKS